MIQSPAATVSYWIIFSGTPCSTTFNGLVIPEIVGWAKANTNLKFSQPNCTFGSHSSYHKCCE